MSQKYFGHISHSRQFVRHRGAISGTMLDTGCVSLGMRPDNAALNCPRFLTLLARQEGIFLTTAWFWRLTEPHNATIKRWVQPDCVPKNHWRPWRHRPRNTTSVLWHSWLSSPENSMKVSASTNDTFRCIFSIHLRTFCSTVTVLSSSWRKLHARLPWTLRAAGLWCLEQNTAIWRVQGDKWVSFFAKDLQRNRYAESPDQLPKKSHKERPGCYCWFISFVIALSQKIHSVRGSW